MINTVREKLTHPVIDGDGHTIEFIPQVIEFFKEIAGTDLTRDFEASICVDGLPNALAARNAGGGANRIRAPWWTGPTRNTLDRATAMFPKLLYQRLDEIGLDYALLYPAYNRTN